MTRFRYRQGLGVPYDRQGLVYFSSRAYAHKTERGKRKIENLCRACAGEHWRALLEYVTTEAGLEEVCMRHFIGRETLLRTVRAYYRRFR